MARALLVLGGMTALDRVLPTPRLLELDEVELALSWDRAWELLRHEDLGRHSRLARLLFAIRTFGAEDFSLALDDLRSTPERPGFQVLVDLPPCEVVIGAIGKVWKPDIPFVHVSNAHAFAAMSEPDYIKVAWAIRLSPLGASDTRVELEVRVDATDDAAWRKFRRYFAVIGPGSRLIRRSLLSALAREYGTPESKENERPLPGDDLLPDASATVTDAITIAARPEAIWPWLVQMGGGRAGFYSIDVLDNAGKRSAREVHPELQNIRVGDVLPARPQGGDGFEVLRVERNRALILGMLFDSVAKRPITFASARPEKFYQMTWSFVLEPVDEGHTRLFARARTVSPNSGRVGSAVLGRVHHLMETAQLRNLARRAEGRMPRDDFRDVAEGISGAAIMMAAFATPFLRSARSHWGLDRSAADRVYPGDELITEPRWSWTHGIEIDAAPDDVWPWIVQIGADEAGFYSYQWLENIAGCALRNAETIHPEWASRGGLVLHPKMPPLEVRDVVPGRWFIAHAPAKHEGSWVETTWLFFVEPLQGGRARFISRYRCACSDDLATRLKFGPALIEPIGFAMDRKMLLGVKQRVEKARRAHDRG